MTICEILTKALVGDLTIPEAADIAGLPERSVLQWIRCRKAGLPSRIEPRPRAKRGRSTSTQLSHVLELYSRDYRGLSAGAFGQALRRDHGITVAVQTLRGALRSAGLAAGTKAPSPNPETRSQRPRPPTDPATDPASSSDVPSLDAFGPRPSEPPDAELVRGLQRVSDQVAVLHARACDATVAWRQGRLSIVPLIEVYAALANGLEQAASDIRRTT